MLYSKAHAAFMENTYIGNETTLHTGNFLPSKALYISVLVILITPFSRWHN